MRKKVISFLIAGVVVLILGFVSTPARSELSLGVLGGYYSPNFGKINDDLEEDFNTPYGTVLGFTGTMMYGLTLGYDLPGRFGLRLEYGSFESKTSDAVSETEDLWEQRVDIDCKVTVRPLLLCLTYGLSPFYLGAGVGSFSTEAEDTFTYELYHDGSLVDSEFDTRSDSDRPSGLMLLVGFRFGTKPTFLNLELRYVVNTKAKLEDVETEVDLSGLQFSLLGGLKF